MQAQNSPFLGLETEATPVMEQQSVSRPRELNFSNGEVLDEVYIIPYNYDFITHCEHPHVRFFTQDFAGVSDLTPQNPSQSSEDFEFASMENDELPLAHHHVLDIDPLLDNVMTLDNGHILRGLHQPIEMPVASPSSAGSAPESLSWELIESVSSEAACDLSTLHPDSSNILKRRDSEPLTWSGASTSKANCRDTLEETSVLFALSLMEGFRYPCPHKTCTKSFKRKEHAKRHYISKHQPKTLRLQCEFCGKDTFTRQDNLNAHRWLHARKHRKNNSGVHFVPAAYEMLLKADKSNLYKWKLLYLLP